MFTCRMFVSYFTSNGSGQDLSILLQIYDATNTTRERRELILNHLKPHCIKVNNILGGTVSR